MHLQEVQVIVFPLMQGNQSELLVYEGNSGVPFEIKRSFVVRSSASITRGHHAHKECSQLLIPLQGRCVVTCDDGSTKEKFVLESPEKGLLIPPGIWAEQEYEEGTILMVLTDRPYEEEDYLREYDSFLNFRSGLKT